MCSAEGEKEAIAHYKGYMHDGPSIFSEPEELLNNGPTLFVILVTYIWVLHLPDNRRTVYIYIVKAFHCTSAVYFTKWYLRYSTYFKNDGSHVLRTTIIEVAEFIQETSQEQSKETTENEATVSPSLDKGMKFWLAMSLYHAVSLSAAPDSASRIVWFSI